MKPTTGSIRVARWFRYALAITLAVAAAIAYLGYMANGIVVGALIGLPGREGDIVHTQHNAMYWLATFAVLQLGLVIAISSVVQPRADATPLIRCFSRGAVGAMLSIPATLISGMVIFAMLQLQHRFSSHMR